MGSVYFLHAESRQPWRAQALVAMNPAELGDAFGGAEAADWLEAAAACGQADAQLRLGACC